MWKSVPDFDTYEVSENGEIRNAKTTKILKPSVHKDGTGMPIVSLVRNGKIHALEVRFVVACTYLGVDIWAKPRPKFEYIDENKFNNAPSNIRIKTTTAFPGEEWKPIKDFEEDYAISNYGRVKRLAHTDTYIRKDTGEEVERHVGEQILKLSEKGGYYEIGLHAKDKSAYRMVHRIVACEFIPNPDNLPQVNHIDGDKHNNKVSNLEWCTCIENVQHAIQSGLRTSCKNANIVQKKVKVLETNQVFNNVKEAAAELGLSYTYLMDCIHAGKPCHGYTCIQEEIDLRVKCLDTGKVYPTLAEACRETGLSSIGDSIKNHTCADGWTFCYVRDNVDENRYLQQARETYSKWPRANKRWEENQ